MSVSRYITANDLDEALKGLSASPNAAIISGGTDLVIDAKEKKKKADVLVDISRIPALKGIKETGDKIYIGSAVKFAELAASPLINQEAKALAQAAGLVGSPQIRNMGTIGGNIANASSAADLIPALLALGAEVEIVSVHEKAVVALESLLEMIQEKGLQDYIITEIILAKNGAAAVSSFKKLGRRSSMAIARINMAGLIVYDEEKRIKKLTLAAGAVGRHAYLINGLDAIASGKEKDSQLVADISAAVQNQVAAVLKTRPTAKYKNEAIKGLVYGILEEI